MSADKPVGTYVCGDSESISVEMAALERYALERGWANTVTYADELAPGNREPRPALARLIHDCRQGWLSVVVIQSISQLGDSISDVISVLEQFRQCTGLQFHSVQESIDSSQPAGRLFFAHVAIFANVVRPNVQLAVQEAISTLSYSARAEGKQ